MSLLTALYRSYEYAEKNKMIGIMDKNGDVILLCIIILRGPMVKILLKS